MIILNHTSRIITLYLPDGHTITIPKSHKKITSPDDLPKERPYTLILVQNAIKTAAPHRKDLITLHLFFSKKLLNIQELDQESRTILTIEKHSNQRKHCQQLGINTGLSIAQERQKLGISQSQLASVAKISHGHLRNLESGSVNFSKKTHDRITAAIRHFQTIKNPTPSTPPSENFVNQSLQPIPTASEKHGSTPKDPHSVSIRKFR